MAKNVYTGILTKTDNKVFIASPDGKRLLEDELIWSGYLLHWLGSAVNARLLEQRDYKTGRPIVIVWPFEKRQEESFIEIYYNERLRKYVVSTLGHIAINVNSEIFNFSHLINENEVITPDEYFYRPALGEFAPHPVTGRLNVENRDMPYYDKFGRRFMRTTHVLRIEGMNTGILHDYFHDRLKNILRTPVDPGRPDEYRDFSIFTNNCSTIIRDGLREYGFKKIKGIFPRDLFVNSAYQLLNLKKSSNIKVTVFKLKQLKVPEADYSALSPLMNLLNRVRLRSLPKY
jgi:hypothetical protein